MFAIDIIGDIGRSTHAGFIRTRTDAGAWLAPAAAPQPFAFAARAFIRLGSLVPLPSTVRPGLRAMIGGGLPDERIVEKMEAGVACFLYDRAGLFPSAFADAELCWIRCPTLVLLRDAERIQAPDAAAARARALISSVTVEVLAGLGHLPGMQDPPVTNARIRAFLD